MWKLVVLLVLVDSLAGEVIKLGKFNCQWLIERFKYFQIESNCCLKINSLITG